MKYIFINANTDLGLHIDGTNQGPSLISKNFNNYEVINVNKNETYIKDKTKDNLAKNLEEINTYNNKLFNTVKNVLQQENFHILSKYCKYN